VFFFTLIRPPSDALEEIAKAQAESFKVGKRDFEKRMSKLTADESRKICAPRLEVERMKAEYEDKLKDLNFRIQAGIALEETAQVSTKQLDEALGEVKQLKEQNQRLQSLLKVVRDGVAMSLLPLLSQTLLLQCHPLLTQETRRKEICPLSTRHTAVPPPSKSLMTNLSSVLLGKIGIVMGIR
jgi:hypothetical protein